MIRKRVLCFLIGIFFALPAVSSDYIEEKQTRFSDVSEEYTDESFEDYVRWETEDYRRRDLQRGDIE